MKFKPQKLYCRIQYDQKNHTIIRLDNLVAFQKFINNPKLNQYYRNQLSLIAVGQEVKADPFVYNVEEVEFEQLVKEIKLKISSLWKSLMNFQQISMVSDSRHYPLIQIVPINREVKEEAVL